MPLGLAYLRSKLLKKEQMKNGSGGLLSGDSTNFYQQGHMQKATGAGSGFFALVRAKIHAGGFAELLVKEESSHNAAFLPSICGFCFWGFLCSIKEPGVFTL